MLFSYKYSKWGIKVHNLEKQKRRCTTNLATRMQHLNSQCDIAGAMKVSTSANGDTLEITR